MDDIDRRILHELTVDARTSLERLAQLCGLAASSVKRRVTRLEKSGVIRGYTARLDHRILGPGLQALIEVFVVAGTSRDSLVASLTAQDEIVRAWSPAGNADAWALVRTRDTDHLEQLVLRLQRTPGFAHTRTQVLLSELINRGG